MKNEERTVVFNLNDRFEIMAYEDSKGRLKLEAVVFEVDWPPERMVFWHKGLKYSPSKPRLDK